jgi:hypothetical protein
MFRSLLSETNLKKSVLAARAFSDASMLPNGLRQSSNVRLGGAVRGLTRSQRG